MPKHKQASAASRGKTSARLSETEIKELPALISTEEYAAVTGLSPLKVAQNCATGKLPAVKCGRRWLINKAKALEQLGL